MQASVFQMTRSKLLFVNGSTGNKELDINFYIYDMDREKFIQERSDKKLLNFQPDCAGNKNFSKDKKIYTSLTNKKVKVFYKDLWYWDTLDVFLIKMEDKKKITSPSMSMGSCCSKRKL